MSECNLVEGEDHVEVNREVFHKPFVEKPVSAEDHNVYIYYPTSAGGGSQRLFRKVPYCLSILFTSGVFGMCVLLLLLLQGEYFHCVLCFRLGAAAVFIPLRALFVRLDLTFMRNSCLQMVQM